MIETIKTSLRPSLGKGIAATVVLCVTGLVAREALVEQAKQETRQRAALFDRNMDVAMGGHKEQIKAAIAGTGACNGRGLFCSSDGSEATWYWHRQSVRGPDTLDVIIPNIHEGRPPQVTLTIFMRDKGADLGSVHPPVREAFAAVAAVMKVSAAALAQCQSVLSQTAIKDGRRTLQCDRRIPAFYQARDGQHVEGSSFTMSVELP